MSKKPMIIAVDGPAGSGKSSLSKALAKELELNYLNTGLLYRALAYVSGLEHVDIKNESELCVFIEHFQKDFRWDIDQHHLYYKQQEISSFLSSEKLGQHASLLGKHPRVRTLLLPLQRELAQSSAKGMILDGRDIGTVVFPFATYKFFVTASIEERAKRRLHQWKEKHGQPPTLEELQQEITARDRQDSSRSAAPLVKAEDAILIDTSGKTFDESLKEMLSFIL